MYGFRQLKDVFKKNKWVLLVTVWSTALICHHLDRIATAPAPIHGDTVNALRREPNSQRKIKSYDVVLNSYMRSGSSLTGIILGYRQDVFYLYEPLWKLARWTYWHGNKTICRSDRQSCRTVEPGKAVSDRNFPQNVRGLPGASLILAKKILSKYFDCLFNDFETTVFHGGVTSKLGGPSWHNVSSCINEKKSTKLCINRFVPRKCKNATHRVTKVLRFTTDLYHDLLKERPNLKVIHLFRDPRAIINSRNNTFWYPHRTQDKLMENAKGLCNKMLYDYKEGKKLQTLYPDRFRFIYYEDLNENPLQKAKLLYEYLGMNLNESRYPYVRKLPVFNDTKNRTAREMNTAYWWRKTLKWEFVEKMEPVCAEVYKQLGYKSITNSSEYNDLSVKTVDIPKQYLLA